MMRLFRGKDMKTGEWVEGDLIISKNQYYIHPIHNSFQVKETGLSGPIVLHEVREDTVSQFTGLTDKNGKLIFEGDLITIPGSKRQGLPAPVKWSNFDARFEISRRGFNSICLDGDEGIYEVIGNIYDISKEHLEYVENLL